MVSPTNTLRQCLLCGMDKNSYISYDAIDSDLKGFIACAITKLFPRRSDPICIDCYRSVLRFKSHFIYIQSFSARRNTLFSFNYSGCALCFVPFDGRIVSESIDLDQLNFLNERYETNFTGSIRICNYCHKIVSDYEELYNTFQFNVHHTPELNQQFSQALNF